MTTVEDLVARALNIERDRVADSLGYQSIAEWDSFAHVQLMLTLERELGIEMSNDLMLELSSIRAIKAHLERNCLEAKPPPPATPCQSTDKQVGIHRGLNGIHFDSSTITRIDGDNGRLEYRGYDVNDLANQASFEEVVWLLLNGELPGWAKLATLRMDMAAARPIPDTVVAVLEFMNEAHPMDALRTAASALGARGVDAHSGNPDAEMKAAVRLIAQIPTLIAAHHTLRQGRTPLAPDPSLGHAHDFLRMLLGREPPPETVRLIEQDLIVHADHGSNASAFAARVAVGAGADLSGAITAALATFAGPLHGGAVEEALRQIDRIGAPENSAAFVRDQQSANRPVMGFGHRVYRTEDPRVRHFRQTARAMSARNNDTQAYRTAEALVEAMQPFARLGIGPNVDLYAGITYRQLGLPDDLATAIFAAGRMPGWIAQVLEQRANNILIRPLLHYVGPASRTYVPISDRPASAGSERVA